MVHVRKHRNIKLESCDKWRNYLVSETNYNENKWLFEKLLPTEMMKIKAVMNKPV